MSMLRYFIFLLLLLPLPGITQAPVWDKWDPEVVNRLHTARETAYLNEEEKKVILFMNMARYNGPLFAETFLEAYVEDKKLTSSSYLKSLRRDLKKLQEIHPLLPEEDLTSVAQGHASKSGQTGHTGHRDFKKRFKPLMGNPYYHVGENCSYGYEQAIEIVVILLIDEGVKGTGHRNNILNREFNSVGVAIRPHKGYRINCVIDYGQKNRSNLNNLPY